MRDYIITFTNDDFEEEVVTLEAHSEREAKKEFVSQYSFSKIISIIEISW
jgi:hypothetical protein